MSEHNESPVFLQLDPVFNPAQKDLPITLYESGEHLWQLLNGCSPDREALVLMMPFFAELHSVENVPSFVFVQANFSIEVGLAPCVTCTHDTSFCGAQQPGAETACWK